MKRTLQKTGFLFMLVLMTYAVVAQTVVYDNGTPKRPTAVNGLVVDGAVYNATFTYNLPLDGTRLSNGIDLTEANVRPFRDSLREIFNRQGVESNLTFIAIVIEDDGSDVQLCYTADGGEGINDWFTDCRATLPFPDQTAQIDYAIADFELVGIISPKKYHVNTTGGDDTNDGLSWNRSFATLQKAIDVTTEGDTIWIAKGIYTPTKDNLGNATPTDNRDKTFYINKNIKIYGSFAGTEITLSERDLTTGDTTFLDGALSATDSTYHVIYIDGATTPITNETVLEGFTIRNGQANGDGSSLNRHSGGAVYNDGSSGESNPILTNITFYNNSANFNGGAIYNNGQSGESSPILTNSTFYSNSAALGGAIYNSGRSGESSPILTNNIFYNNSVHGVGGAIYNDGVTGKSNPILTNSTFYNNSANLTGGAIYSIGRLGQSNPILTNNTFYNNSAADGGAIHNTYARLTITNTIFWENKGEDDNNNVPGADILNDFIVNVTYSLVQENSAFSTGDGMISNQDPMFTDATNGDFRLLVGSPAIDKGNNDSVPDNIMTDLAGNDRIQNTTVDMGAYEFGKQCTISTITTTNLSDCQEGAISSTFTADVTIIFEDAPTSGTLNLTGDGLASVDISMLDNETSHTFKGVTMTADGETIDLTATFSDDTNCTFNNSNAGIASVDCSCENPVMTEFATDFSFLSEIWGDVNGNLFVMELFDGNVIKIDAEGVKTDFATDLGFPHGIWGDSNGNLFVTNNEIIKISAEGTKTDFVTDIDVNTYRGVWGDGNGNLFVAERENSKIVKINAEGTKTDFVTGVGSPHGIWGDINGNLFITELNNNKVIKIDAEGIKTDFVTEVSSPYGIWGDGNGNLFVAERENSKIVKINAEGTKTDFVTGMSFPYDIWGDANGNLFVTEGGNSNKVTKIGCPTCLVNAGVDTTVCNNNYTLQGTALQTGETGQWTFVDNPNNQGTLTNPTSPNAFVNANFDAEELLATNLSRTFKLKWTVTGGSCGEGMSDEMMITLNPPVNAGSDRLNICGTTINLGAAPASGGTGKWSFISNPDNSGSIADLSNSNATLTGIIGGNYELEWTVTGGACDGSMDRVKLAFQPDSDDDTFQDCEDLCEGGDDRINTDNTGVPDACDCDINDTANELVTLDAASFTTFMNEHIGQDTAKRIADFQLTATTTVIEATHPVVVFQASNSVTLQSGFHAKIGSNFIAEIGYCKDPLANPFLEEQQASSRTQRTNVEPTGSIIDMSVFPNPMKQEAAINLTLPADMLVDLVLFNQNGQLIRQYINSKEAVKGAHYYKLDASKLSDGLYFLQLRSEEGVMTKKLVIQKY